MISLIRKIFVVVAYVLLIFGFICFGLFGLFLIKNLIKNGNFNVFEVLTFGTLSFSFIFWFLILLFIVFFWGLIYFALINYDKKWEKKEKELEIAENKPKISQNIKEKKELKSIEKKNQKE